jgi:F0F1-type ATP synthase gamma subunit
MANTQDIRRRIKSVSGTAQITNAMQLVAASKMKRRRIMPAPDGHMLFC